MRSRYGFHVAEDEYSWAEAGEIDALAVTYLRHAGPIEDVFEASGNRWTPIPRATIDRVLEHVDGFDPDREPMLVDRLGPWYVLLAPNGFEFSYPGVAAGASRLGRLVTVFWNVNAVMRVVVAEAGRVTRSFDPLMPEDSEGTPLAEEDGLSFGEPGRPRSASLHLAERLTGQRLTREFFTGEHDAIVLMRRVWASDDPGCNAIAPLPGR
jgi:hypothetical protein